MKKGGMEVSKISIITATYLSLMCLASSVFADSAFGIKYGGELPKGAVPTDDAGKFRVVSPPNPHSLFEDYVVRYTPETGVCHIQGYTKTFEPDKYGTKAKDAYDSLVASLGKKYGPNGDKWEVLMPDALWDEPDEFAMSLHEGDRKHARWFTPKANSKREFDYVQIVILGLDSSSTYIHLSYQNENLFKECKETISESDNSSL